MSGESPMIETTKPTTSITLDRELIRAAPITSRRAVQRRARPGAGRLVPQRGRRRRAPRLLFQGRGDLLARVHSSRARRPDRSSIRRRTRSGSAATRSQDSELKLAGVDASSPIGTGVVMNIMAPRGGNQFKGGANYDYQTATGTATTRRAAARPAAFRRRSR